MTNMDKKNLKDDALSNARKHGVDIQMLRDNLKRSVSERIRRHQIALDTCHKLRNAKKL